MGKKDGGKKGELDKKQAKKARQAAKQQKTALKRSKKENKDGEDIEKIIREFNAKEAAKTAVTVEVSPPPSRRSNFTLTPLPTGEVCVYLDFHPSILYSYSKFNRISRIGGGLWRRVLRRRGRDSV